MTWRVIAQISKARIWNGFSVITFYITYLCNDAFPCFSSVVQCNTPPFEESDIQVPDNLPTERSYNIVIYCVILGVIETTGISIVVTLWSEKLHEKDPLVISVLTILLASLLVSMLLVWRQPQNKQQLYFKVPLLPWLPFLSMFFNIYLMVSLNKLTWLRFAIWMVVGK